MLKTLKLMNLSNKELKKWILIMCSLTKEEGGIHPIRLYEDNRIGLTFVEINKLLDELEKAEFIKSNKEITEILLRFNITPKGEKEIRNIPEVEYYKLLKLSSLEYSLRYRISNIEKSIIFSISSYLFFNLTIFLIKQNYLIGSILSLIITMVIIELSIFSIVNVSIPFLTSIINRILKKSYDLLSYRIKIIKYILIGIISLIGLYLWFKFNPENFKDSIWATGIALGITLLINYERQIEKFLNNLKERIK